MWKMYVYAQWDFFRYFQFRPDIGCVFLGMPLKLILKFFSNITVQIRLYYVNFYERESEEEVTEV